MWIRTVGALSILFVTLALASTGVRAGETRSVVVNRVALDAKTLSSVEVTLGTRILDGRYWYDPLSGLYGVEGGPAAGQIAPGLSLGGPLRGDASASGLPVFVNGRAIHPIEAMQLMARFGTVVPGRYWLRADGVGGFEGAPPSFRLWGGSAGGSASSGLDHDDRGSVIGGDGIVGYIGGGVGITCGPDGGCF